MSFPLELDGKTVWPTDKSRAKYEQCRREAVSELRARDIERGLPADGCTYLIHTDDAGHQSASVNPLWVSLKHTGDEAMELTEDKWAEFTDEPRDSKMFAIPRISRAERKAQGRSKLPAVQTPEFPNAGVQEVTPGSNSPVPRRPGRPRKQQLMAMA